MKLGFLELPPAERRVYIEQAALDRGLSPVVLEKDFWVCWLLGVLFRSRFADSLVFKGGTSLSKVFGAIDRFSEDIDLSLSPTFLGLPEAGASRNQATKWMRNAEAACGAAVEAQIAPALEEAVGEVLGKREGGWFEYLMDPGTNSPVVLFHYPSAQPAGFEYLRRSVKLEFGSLTDQQPAGRHPVRPWVADILPAAFPDWSCEVVALEVERTFWEKATILYTEYHRPADKPTPDRFSRHYADTAALAKHPSAAAALTQHETRDRVSVEGEILRQLVGELRSRQAGHLQACPPGRTSRRPRARLPGHAGHVSLGSADLRRRAGCARGAREANERGRRRVSVQPGGK